MKMVVLSADELRVWGSATTVYRKVMKGFKNGEAEVPCDGCRACCKTLKEVMLTEEEAQRLSHTISQKGQPIIARQENGVCLYLAENGCGIYTNRPRVCRMYDCRVYALASMIPQTLREDPDYRPARVSVNSFEDRVLAMTIGIQYLQLIDQGVDDSEAPLLALKVDEDNLCKAAKLMVELQNHPEILKKTIQECADELGGTTNGR